ncbi:MAG: hypothetical protein WCW25_01235 [Patescibacteria group bacterium]|jgi:hypothetical protein
MKKKLIQLMMAMMVIIPLLSVAVTVNAQALTTNDLGLNDANDIGLGNEDPKSIIVNVIRVILGFLGLIAVIIILIGGFKWMTAQGNDDKITEARKLIQAGAIGLVIVLAAFGITQFLINTIFEATGGTPAV